METGVVDVALGQRIRQARIAAHLSMRELAVKVGVSHTAIAKYERDHIAPGPSTLIRLARVLDVRTEYFFREQRVELSAPAYRKRSRLPVRSQAAIEAGLKSALELYFFVEDLFPAERQVQFDFKPEPVEEIEDAEAAAESLRRAWDLGSDPVEDLTARLEDHGVKVLILPPRPGFDGFSCWANQTIPVIACPSGGAGDRQRFSLAHELGHLLLRVVGDVDPEKAAHRFAGALLAPRHAVYRELGRKRRRLALDELLLLKQEYGMSMQAWTRRALDLDVITQVTYRHTCQLFAKLRWRTQEPGDEVPEERPWRLKLLVYQAVAEDLLTPSTAATLLGRPRSERSGVPEAMLGAAADMMALEYERNRELTAFTDANTEDIRLYGDD